MNIADQAAIHQCLSWPTFTMANTRAPIYVSYSGVQWCRDVLLRNGLWNPYYVIMTLFKDIRQH